MFSISEILSNKGKTMGDLTGKRDYDQYGPIEILNPDSTWKFVTIDHQKETELDEWNKIVSGEDGWLNGRFIQFPLEYNYAVGHLALEGNSKENFFVVLSVWFKENKVNEYTTFPIKFRVSVKIEQTDNSYLQSNDHQLIISESIFGNPKPDSFLVKFGNCSFVDRLPRIIFKFEHSPLLH